MYLGGVRTSGSDRSYEYVQAWSEHLINSDDFQGHQLIGGEDHVNPKSMPPYESEDIKASALRIGAWQLADSYAWRVGQWQPLPQDVLYAGTSPDSWMHSGGYVYPRKVSEDILATGIGAVRVSYQYAPVAAGNYSVIGIARDGVLYDDEVFAEVIGPPLIEPGEVDAETMVARAEEYANQGDAPTNNPFAWVFIGLLISLRALALPFPVLRGFTHAPVGRRLMISGGVATLVTIIAAIFFRG